MRKSELEDQIESLQDVLTDIREMIYGALEPSEEESEVQLETLRTVLSDIEEMIDGALEPLDLEDAEEAEDEDAED